MPDSDILVSIVIPIYNEEEAVGVVLDDVTRAAETLECGWEILVINDGCTDRTCAICATYPHVRMVTHRRNMGNGAARTTGIKNALGRYVVMIDADATYPADEIPRLVKELETCDMVIGARGKEMGTLKWLRSSAKEFIRLLASYLTQTRIPDLNSGMRAMKRDLVPQFFGILPTTHSWVSTITMAFLSSGYEVRWVPIAYFKRIGRSTFDPIGDTYNYISLVVRTMMYFNPLRMFLPVVLAMFAVGIAKMVYDIIAYSWHFAPSTVILLFTAFQLMAVGLLADLIVRRTKS